MIYDISANYHPIPFSNLNKSNSLFLIVSYILVALQGNGYMLGICKCKVMQPERPHKQQVTIQMENNQENTACLQHNFTILVHE